MQTRHVDGLSKCNQSERFRQGPSPNIEAVNTVLSGTKPFVPRETFAGCRSQLMCVEDMRK